MGPYTEIITQIKPKNDANFGVADVNDLIGGYIQVGTNVEMLEYLTKYSRRLKVGMLCYVIEENQFYLYRYETWNLWSFGGAHAPDRPEGSGVVVVETMEEAQEYANLGLIVYVQNLAQLYYYSPTGWRTFTRIYIQDEAPSDVGGLWIDTKDSGFEQSNDFTKSLLKMINLLSRRVSLLEYMNQLIQSGKFDNNMYDVYGNIIDIDPALEITGDEPTTQEWDDDNTELLNNTLLSDSTEPTYYKDLLPNVKHIQIKWGKYDDMLKYKDLFLPAELLWCYDKRQLWIKDPHSYQLIQIGTAQASGDVTDDDIMNGIIQDSTEQYIQSITFVDMLDSTKHYSFSVLNGELDLYDLSLDTYPAAIDASQVNGTLGNYESLKVAYLSNASNFGILELNAVYGASYSEYNGCDYNFVEISNKFENDVNLNGLYLHYTNDGSTWITLPLKGVVKARSTFLIRGARSANSTYSAIHIDSADMYWTKDQTLNVNTLENVNNVFDENNLIVFSDECSLLLTGPLTSTTNNNDTITPTLLLLRNGFSLSTPWDNSSSTIKVVCGFIDLVGFAKLKTMPVIVKSPGALDPYKLYKKTFSLDPASQANKSIIDKASNNSSRWKYINLKEPDQEIDLSVWNLKKGGHDLFFDKHKISDGKPTVVTCSFGHNPHTTRCFNWVSKGYRDEFIRYRKQGETAWQVRESFKYNDGRSEYTDSIYNRIRAVASDGTKFTAHKIIIKFIEPDPILVYEYQVGYGDYFTDIKTFTLRSRRSVIDNGFSFVLVTDQQGFHAEEYDTWRLSAEFINNEYNKENTEESKIHFTINTGDATLNGNRMGEWIDYFNAGTSLFDHFELMYTVGNNDLCPIIPQAFSDGSDLNKSNPINVQFFFTFEQFDDNIPKYNGVYIPCCYSFVYGDTLFLCANSELTDSKKGGAAEAIFGASAGVLYSEVVEPWAVSELAHITDEVQWKIAYCHENPFVLLVSDTFGKYQNGETGSEKTRGTETSHFNKPGNFWFSKFLETNFFNLSICGHKHTFSTSYYLIDNEDDRMKPYVYAPDYNAEGETHSSDGAILVNPVNSAPPTNDGEPRGFVKYTMCLATGFKVVSNKELPCTNINWLESYYPTTSDASTQEPLKFPHYIVWNIGVGNEKKNRSELPSSRPRILGVVKKLKDKNKTTMIKYDYNAPILLKDVEAIDGNGSNANSSNYIIVEKLS